MPDSIPAPFDQGRFLVHLNRGKELFEQGVLDRAELDLVQARRMRPHDQKVLNLLGLVYFKQEKYREADEVYRQLILGNPGSLTLHFNHGLICFKLSNLDHAEAAFLRALEIQPDSPKIHFYLGNIYERKKQYYNAIFQYRKAGANIMVKRVQAKIASEPDRASAPSSTETTLAPPTRPSPNAEPKTAEHNRLLKEQLVGELLATPPPEVEVPVLDDPIPEIKVTVDHIDRHRFLASLSQAPTLVPPQAPSSGRGEIPPPPPAPGRLAPRGRTVIRHLEPAESDAHFSELVHTKVLSSAEPTLFSAAPARPFLSSPDDTARLGAPPIIRSEPDLPEERRAGDPEDRSMGKVYSHLRRRDDTFRYLEHNLMEVNFSGKVYIKQGTIYSYTGNLTFWVKPQREEEAVPPMVIVSGTGKLFLTDAQREITVLQVAGEKVLVEPSHLLACEETLTPRYALIEQEGSASPRLHVLSIEGTGMLALSVRTRPLLLRVSPDYPVNVSSASLISWSGSLSPVIVDDEALTELMLPYTRHGVTLRLEGTGKVMMERSST